MANLNIVFMFFCSLLLVVFVSGNSYPFFSKIQLPPGVTGPESAAFDAAGGGPYVSVTDGRVLKWDSKLNVFVEFAYTAPNRCDGTTDPNMGPICGRPLGLSFYYATGFLYIVDAYFGFLVVGPQGGLALQLATSAEGVPFKFTDGVDVDQQSGLVFFTHASETFNLWNATQPGFKPDSTGRLLKYDPVTKQVIVLLRGLAGAGGPAVSFDSSFVLVSEYVSKRIQKFWLTGVKANTAEILINLPGNPSKIKRSDTEGEYWVALNVISQQPILFTAPQGLRINGLGMLLETLPLVTGYFNASIAVVQEHNSALYIGSRDTDFVGVFKKGP
ncbi:protein STRICTOSIDINE SYNTHASE-LIKE 12-like [Rhododendron vialii]|uniref:protein STRICTOSIDINE SYNTHASE-LIKE 12-like n=1 Tax=Rhododendron vialii TaxID=182163 RepID=UPI00265FDA9C|nr:protein STRICTOSIDINE SYNTHASE-LIKE 12-like [Rhododendron vialii]